MRNFIVAYFLTLRRTTYQGDVHVFISGEVVKDEFVC